LKQLVDEIFILFREFTVVDALDVLLVAFIIYKVLMLIRGTRAWRIVLGALVFLFLLVISDRLKLHALHWLLDRAAVWLPVALVILLMPELRQLIEGMTRLRFLGITPEDNTEVRTIEEIVAAVAELASSRVGALIVIERNDKLDEIASTGVLISARVSTPLLGSIFYEGNPLHDGAVIVRGDSIFAAACRLPLSESRRVDRAVHMRHRAALGVTEVFDCVTIVVSEERGTISCAIGETLRKLNTPAELRDLLNREVRRHEMQDRTKSLLSLRPRAEVKR
jgi:diadenylate cyclase